MPMDSPALGCMSLLVSVSDLVAALWLPGTRLCTNLMNIRSQIKTALLPPCVPGPISQCSPIPLSPCPPVPPTPCAHAVCASVSSRAASQPSPHHPGFRLTSPTPAPLHSCFSTPISSYAHAPMHFTHLSAAASCMGGSWLMRMLWMFYSAGAVSSSGVLVPRPGCRAS